MESVYKRNKTEKQKIIIKCTHTLAHFSINILALYWIWLIYLSVFVVSSWYDVRITFAAEHFHTDSHSDQSLRYHMFALYKLLLRWRNRFLLFYLLSLKGSRCLWWTWNGSITNIIFKVNSLSTVILAVRLTTAFKFTLNLGSVWVIRTGTKTCFT